MLISQRELEQRVAQLKVITDLQCADGNWNADEYMRGLANGLILARAIMENKEPEYKKSKQEDGID